MPAVPRSRELAPDAPAAHGPVRVHAAEPGRLARYGRAAASRALISGASSWSTASGSALVKA